MCGAVSAQWVEVACPVTGWTCGDARSSYCLPEPAHGCLTDMTTILPSVNSLFCGVWLLLDCHGWYGFSYCLLWLLNWVGWCSLKVLSRQVWQSPPYWGSFFCSLDALSQWESQVIPSVPRLLFCGEEPWALIWSNHKVC